MSPSAAPWIPSLNWIQRFWSNNGAGGSALFAQTVPNVLNPANPTMRQKRRRLA